MPKMTLFLTYKQVDFLLQWAATLLTLAGAILTSTALHPYNVWAFTAGTALWLVWAIRIRNTSLTVVNAGLLVIYVTGVIHGLV